MIALDCSTYSCARFFNASTKKLHSAVDTPGVDPGPKPVRTREFPDGLPSDQLTAAQEQELKLANKIAWRAFKIAKLARFSSSKATIILENPADRTLQSTCAYWADLPDHGSLFATTYFTDFIKEIGPCSSCTSAMCRYGSDVQKYTTLWYTTDAATELDKNNGPEHQCCHKNHTRTVGGRAPDGTFHSSDFSAYSDGYNTMITKGFQFARTGSTAPLGATPVAPPSASQPPASAPPTTDTLSNDLADLQPSLPLPPRPLRSGAASFVPSSPPASSPVADMPSPIAFPSFDSIADHLSADEPPGTPFVEGRAQPPDPPFSVQGQTQRAVRQSTLDARPLDTIHEALLGYCPSDTASEMEARVAELIWDTHVGPRPEFTPISQWSNLSEADDGNLWDLLGASSRSERVSHNTLVMDAHSAQHALLTASTGSSLPRVVHQSLFAELAKIHVALRADSDGAPSSHPEAVKMGEPWGSAELKEMNNHASNASWTTIRREDVPRGRKLHKLVWVYKRKRDGTAKGRLCVQGCTLLGGIDYDQTFSSTLRHSSCRAIFSFAARCGCHVRSIDYVAAYLQGKFTEGEVIYCFMAPGYEQYGADGAPLVLRIEKPIYGIPQAGRRLQRQIFPWLKSLGLRQLDEADSCVWVYDDPASKEKFVLGVYVDNLQIAHSAVLNSSGVPIDPSSFYAKFLKKLTSEWDVVDEGPMEDLLAIQLRHNNDYSFTIHQQSYIEKLIAKFLPNGAPPTVQKNTLPYSNNFLENLNHALAIEGPPAHPRLVRPFQERIGALMYLTTSTRPDISYSTHKLAQAMSKPTPELMLEVDHVLAYLDRHKSVGITYDHGRDPKFHGFADASWETRWSTNGWIIMFSNAAVAWGSTKQNCVAQSSCEAEIIALSEAAKDMIYFRKLFGGIDKLFTPEPSPLATDNMAARDLSYNPEHHARTKHVERRHFYIRDMVEKFELIVPHVSTEKNLADFLTKPMNAKRFIKFRGMIMNEPRDRAADL